MITFCEENYSQIYRGLSSDKKPVTNVANGSLFIEMDTNKCYLFDLEHKKWLLQKNEH